MPQFRGQLALLFNGIQDGLLAFIQFVQLIPQTTDRTNLQFVQSAGAFLAIATDEGNGGTLVEELDRLFNLPFRDAGELGNQGVNLFIHV